MTSRPINYAWGLMHQAHMPFVAQRFSDARVSRKISRTELALLCDFNNLDHGLWEIEAAESGEYPPVTFWAAKRLAEPLGIDIGDLWDELQDRETERRRREHEWHPPVLGDLIKSARIARGLTIREIEQRARLPKYFPVSDLEEGVVRFPTDAVLESLSRVLELDPEAARSARAEEFAFYDDLAGHFSDRDSSPIIIACGVPGAVEIDFPDGLDAAGIVAFAENIVGDDFWVPEWRDPTVNILSPNRLMVFFPDGRKVSFRGRQPERIEFGACFEMRDGHDWKGEYYAC